MWVGTLSTEKAKEFGGFRFRKKVTKVTTDVLTCYEESEDK